MGSEAELQHAAGPDVPLGLRRVLEHNQSGGDRDPGGGQVGTPTHGQRSHTRPAVSSLRVICNDNKSVQSLLSTAQKLSWLRQGESAEKLTVCLLLSPSGHHSFIGQI